jgi:hypothetical protein
MLEYRQDRTDLAIGSLTQAYRASTAPEFAAPRIVSASVLSAVMRSTGDYAQALALNQEVVDWDTQQGATLSLSVNRFRGGKILNLMGGYTSALGEFAIGLPTCKINIVENDEFEERFGRERSRFFAACRLHDCIGPLGRQLLGQRGAQHFIVVDKEHALCTGHVGGISASGDRSELYPVFGRRCMWDGHDKVYQPPA